MGTGHETAKLAFPLVLLMALLVGVVTGLIVALYYLVAISLVWRRSLPALFAPGAVLVFPAAALFFAGLVLWFLARGDVLQGSESVVEDYRVGAAGRDLEVAPWKVASSVLVVGLGGSAGISNPSIYAGGSIAEYFYRILGIDPKDTESFKAILMAGAAAGMAAAFRAPLAATLLAMELPLKKAYSVKLAAPALISSLASYAIAASALGMQPLVPVRTIGGFTFSDVISAAAVGLICGSIGRIYVVLYDMVKTAFEESRVALYVKTLLGGLAAGFAAFFGFIFSGTPYVLGIGYDALRPTVELAYSPVVLVFLVFLKAVATVSTLGSGAFGGMIEPLVLMGAGTGAAWAGAVPLGSPSLVSIAGMAGFFSAAYKVPLASAVLAVELTRAPSALVPALATSLAAWAVSGSDSVLKRR